MAEEGQVIACHTVESWNQHLQSAKDSKKLSVANDWDLKAMPTIIFMKEGNIVDKVVGANRVDLQTKLNLHASA